MDANLLGECIREASEPVCTCNTTNKLLSVDLSPSKQEDECCHFSIRGYVASVRKGDRKVCWPFCSIRAECNLENDENFLPPIAVAEFRWWNCKKCLLKDHTRESNGLREILPDGDEVTKFLPDVNVNLDVDANMHKHLVGHPLIGSTVPPTEAMPVENCKSYEETGVADIIDEGAIYNLEDEVLQHSMLAHELREEQNFQMFDPIYGLNGTHSLSKLPISQSEDADGSTDIETNTIPKDAGVTCHQDFENKVVIERKNVVSDKPEPSTGAIASSWEDSPPKSDGVESPEPSNHGSGQRDCETTANNDRIIESEEEDDHVDPLGNRSEILNQRRVRRTRMLSDIIESEVSRMPKPIPEIVRRVSVNSEDDVPHVNIKENGKVGDPKEEVKSICKMNNKSNMNIGISGDEPTCFNDKNSGKTNNLKEELKNTSKKHSKSRAISAISKVVGTHSVVKINGKINNLKEEVKHKNKKHKQAKVIPAVSEDETTPADDKNSEKNDNLKEESSHACKKYKFLAQEKGKKKKHRKRSELLEIVDEGSSLIHWMRRTSKKFGAFKQDSDSRYHNSINGHSDSPRIASNETLSFRKKEYPCFQENNIEKSKKKRQMPLVEVGKKSFSQQRAETQNCLSSNNGCKEIRSGDSYLTSTKLPVTSNPLNPETPCLVRQNGKAIVNNLQGDKNQAKDRGNLLISKQKESDSVPNNKIIDVPRGCNKVSKKRTAQEEEHKADTASVDGIPVEILKLLQENYHKRHPDESINVKTGDASTSKEAENGKGLKCIDLSAYEASTEQHRQQQQCQVSSSKCFSIDTQVSALPKDHHQRTPPHVTLGDQHERTEKRHRNVSCENEESGKCRNMINLNKQFDVSIGLLESSNYRKAPGNGSPIHSIPINANGCLLQDLNERWVMNSEKDFVESCRLPSLNTHGDCYNRQTSTLMGAISFGFRDPQAPNIQIDAKGKETLATDASMKRKRMTGETDYTKAADETLARLKKRKQLVNFQSYMETPLASEMPYLEARKEYNADIIRALDRGTNETISALNLLRLMDPAVCSSAHMCADKSSCKFSEQSNFAKNYVPKISFKASFGNRNDGENKNPPASENVNWHYRSRSLNLYNTAPRIGVPVPFYLKDDITDSLNHDPRTLLPPFVGCGNRDVCSYLQNSNRSPTNTCASQSRVAPYCSLLNNGNQEVTLSYQNLTTLPCGDMVPAGQDKVETFQIQKSSCATEHCVVNRNPADFMIPGEDNEFMTGYEDLQPGGSSLHEEREYLVCPDDRRKRKALSLIATKGLLRS